MTLTGLDGPRESVVAGWNRRVGGEACHASNLMMGVGKGHPIFMHQIADHLQRPKSRVPLVQVVDTGVDAQSVQRFDAANTEHQFLTNARSLVAAIQPAGQLTVFRLVALHIAVEKIKPHTAHMHQPDFRHQLAVTGVDRNRDRLSLGVTRGLHRQVIDLGYQVVFALVSILVQVLAKVPLCVVEPDPDQGNAQAGRTLDVVTR